MPRILTLTFLFASAVHAQPADSIAWGIPDGWTDSGAERFAEWAGTVASVAGLTSLAETALPAGDREVRLLVTASFGYDVLYRFVVRDTVASGDAWLLWNVSPPDPERPEQPGETYHDLTLFRLGQMCMAGSVRIGPGRYGDRLAACRMAFDAPPDWASLIHDAEALGLRTLPDESAVAPPEDSFIGHTDGTLYDVEVRDGERYRVYSYLNPAPSKGPAFAAADSLFRLIWDTVNERLASPGTDRTYRGTYTGLFSDAADAQAGFRPCSQDGEWEVWGVRRLSYEDEEIARLEAHAGVTIVGTLLPSWASDLESSDHQILIATSVEETEAPCTGP